MANEILASYTLPSLSSTDIEWMQWYSSLRDDHPRSKDQVNLTFLKMWNDRGTSKANTERLREYMAANHVEIEAGLYDSIMDTITDPFGIVSGAKSVVNTTRMIWTVVFIAIMGVIVLALYNIARDPEPYAKIAADIFSPNPMK